MSRRREVYVPEEHVGHVHDGLAILGGQALRDYDDRLLAAVVTAWDRIGCGQWAIVDDLVSAGWRGHDVDEDCRYAWSKLAVEGRIRRALYGRPRAKLRHEADALIHACCALRLTRYAPVVERGGDWERLREEWMGRPAQVEAVEASRLRREERRARIACSAVEQSGSSSGS